MNGHMWSKMWSNIFFIPKDCFNFLKQKNLENENKFQTKKRGKSKFNFD